MLYKRIITLFFQFCNQLLFQSYCSACRVLIFSADDILCNACIKQIDSIASIAIPLTKTKQMRIFALSNYQAPLRQLILAKTRSDIIASKQLGLLIWQMSCLKNMHFDVIIPVPLHWTRSAWRGYNQAYEIARVIAQKSGKPIVQAVRRKKRTAYQLYFSKNKRQENVSDVFVLHHSAAIVRGKRILLVDDLMTTGSTLQAVAKELLKEKPAEIMAVVACRVV